MRSVDDWANAIGREGEIDVANPHLQLAGAPRAA